MAGVADDRRRSAIPRRGGLPGLPRGSGGDGGIVSHHLVRGARSDAWDSARGLPPSPALLPRRCTILSETSGSNICANWHSSFWATPRMTAARMFLSMPTPSNAPASAISGRARRSASSWSRPPARERRLRNGSRPSEADPTLPGRRRPGSRQRRCGEKAGLQYLALDSRQFPFCSTRKVARPRHSGTQKLIRVLRPRLARQFDEPRDLD